MKIKALLFLFGMITFQQITYAQKHEFKFGKISPEDFQTKAPGKDSAAAALKLFDVGNCYFEYAESTGFRYVFQRHIRYKILTKAGYDLANYKVGLYRSNGASKEELTGMEAATYNIVDGKIVTSKPNKDAKFTEEFNKNITYKKYALPNVKEGSVIEFKYTIKSDFIFNLRGWSFQSDIPTLYAEYNVKIPQYFSYKTNLSGYLPINKTKHERVNASYVAGLASSDIYDQYVMENVPALKDEAFITTMDDYIPMVEFELQATQFPNQTVKDYNSSWPMIVKELAEDDNFGLFVGKNAYAKSILPTLLKGEKDTLIAAKLIFDYVKNNVKWNGDRNKYTTSTNPKAIFEKKTGNSADINLSLINFLREAKIDARPLLISTRENGMHPGYPMISKFNNVVANVVINNKNITLDATNKDLPLGMIAYENLSHQGLCVDLKNITAGWITTETTFVNEKTYNYSLVLNNENKLVGKVNLYTTGYAALDLRDKFKSTNNETEFLKNYKNDKAGLTVSNYKMVNLNNVDELLIESMDVNIDDNVEEAGNLIYFSPLLFEKTKENPFKHEERVFPVDFAYPFKETYRVAVTFPDNYDIEKLPRSVSYAIPDKKGDFTISFFEEGKTLLVRSVISIPKSLYTPEEYFDLKELFKAVVEKQAEQIVFKKKTE